MLNYEFGDPETGGKNKLCWSWFKEKVWVKALVILSAFCIVMVNLLLQVNLRHTLPQLAYLSRPA